VRSLAHVPATGTAAAAAAAAASGSGFGSILARARAKWWLLASAWNVTDFALILYGIAGSCALLAGAHERLPLAAADFFEASRAARVLRLAVRLPFARSLLGTLAGVLPMLASFAGVYVALIYSFALVGQALTASPARAVNDDSLFSPEGLCQKCQEFRMETLPMALLSLLSLSVGNNWNSILYPQLQIGGSRWLVLYFCLYRFVMTDVVLILIISLVISGFERSAELAERAGLEEALASALVRRAAGGVLPAATYDGEGAGAVAGVVEAGDKPKVALWASSELLHELSAVEEAMARRRAAKQRERLVVEQLGAAAPRRPGHESEAVKAARSPSSSANVLELYGVTGSQLVAIEARLRELENEQVHSPRPANGFALSKLVN
jgi:hypothetical protein